MVLVVGGLLVAAWLTPAGAAPSLRSAEAARPALLLAPALGMAPVLGMAPALAAETPVPAAPEAQGVGGRRVAPELLRSLVLPGWGEWHQGHRDLGLAFLTIEAALVGTVAVSIGQGHLRRGSSERTAESFAGIDLRNHPDQFRSWLADYQSSDEYNRLVVYRDAAARYYGDPVNYNRYIDEHSLKGADSWSWESHDALTQYRLERRGYQHAFQRASFAAAGMLINALASAVTSGYLAGKSHDRHAQASGPESGVAMGRLEWTVEPTRAYGFAHRVAWVYRF
jgi:hypothetical protein